MRFRLFAAVAALVFEPWVAYGATDNVTGPIDTSVTPPVIHALVVQTPFWVDKVASPSKPRISAPGSA